MKYQALELPEMRDTEYKIFFEVSETSRKIGLRNVPPTLLAMSRHETYQNIKNGLFPLDYISKMSFFHLITSYFQGKVKFPI